MLKYNLVFVIDIFVGLKILMSTFFSLEFYQRKSFLRALTVT